MQSMDMGFSEGVVLSLWPAKVCPVPLLHRADQSSAAGARSPQCSSAADAAGSDITAQVLGLALQADASNSKSSADSRSGPWLQAWA